MKRIGAWILTPLLLALPAAGCGSGDRPRIAAGSRCAACSMDIADLRFASARKVQGRWRGYDAIECLIRDAAATPGGPAWLSDYDARTLHPADSMWVVKGSFPTPMSGGFAAFLDPSGADEVARETKGAVDRFDAWAAKGWP